MANEYYITAGLPPNDTDQANTANTYYISAGLIDEDVASGGGGIEIYRRRIEGH